MVYNGGGRRTIVNNKEMNNYVIDPQIDTNRLFNLTIFITLQREWD